MTLTSYTYSISQDCPDGAVNTGQLQTAIQQSPITISLGHIDTSDGNLIIYFKAALSNEDQIILDGGSGTPYGTHPAGGLIANTDTSETLISSPLITSNIKPTNYNRRYGFSPNFCDQTTWWEQAVKITNEAVGSGDGTTTIFRLSHGNEHISGEAILDLQHGKVTEEDFIEPLSGKPGDFNVVVIVNGNVKTQRDAFEISGGDYILDYLDGKITFFTAPANAESITCTYWYIPNNVGPTFTMLPSPGMQLIVDDVECSFSGDIEMLDTTCSGAWLNDYSMWAPVPKNPTSYKTMSDYYNYTYGAFPALDPIGANARGYAQPSLTLRWDFKSYLIFTDGDKGAPCFKMITKHNRKPFSGLSSTITIYAMEVPLSSKLI